MNLALDIQLTETFKIVKRHVRSGKVSEKECLDIAEEYLGLSIEAAEIRKRAYEIQAKQKSQGM